jgi:hypothetical protein
MKATGLAALAPCRKLGCIIGLLGERMVTVGLSVKGLANVAMRDSDNDFIFIVSGHRYQGRLLLPVTVTSRLPLSFEGYGHR